MQGQYFRDGLANCKLLSKGKSICRVSEVWLGPKMSMAALAEADTNLRAELEFDANCVAHGIVLSFVLNYDCGDVVVDTEMMSQDLNDDVTGFETK